MAIVDLPRLTAAEVAAWFKSGPIAPLVAVAAKWQ